MAEAFYNTWVTSLTHISCYAVIDIDTIKG